MRQSEQIQEMLDHFERRLATRYGLPLGPQEALTPADVLPATTTPPAETNPASASPAPAIGNPEPTGPGGAPIGADDQSEATAANTPRATAAQLELINQAPPEKRAALRLIAMRDAPHSVRTAEMKAELSKPAP